VGRPRRKEGEWSEGPLLAITTMFCSEFAYGFRLSVSMRKVAGEHPFCELIYMNSYIFHICYILFILLSYLTFDFVYSTLSLADTHGISKYACTYIQDTHTHAHTPKKKVKRLGKKKGEKVERYTHTRTHNKKKSRKTREKEGGKSRKNQKKEGGSERNKKEKEKEQKEKGGQEGGK